MGIGLAAFPRPLRRRCRWRRSGRRSEFRAYGAEGSYVSSGPDVQAQAIFSGKRPLDDLEGWEYEMSDLWGTLRTAEGHERIPSEQGRYHAYYDVFAGSGPPPATAEEAIAVLGALDSARISATERRTVDV